MNYLDLIVVAILALCMLFAYKKGFVMSLFGLVSTALSIVLAYTIYPVVARFIRGVPAVYSFFYDSAKSALNLDETIYQHSMDMQNDLIAGLPLPKVLTDTLIENNNPVLYNLLNVSKIEEYVLSYVTNICINVLSIVLVFISVYIVMKLIAQTLNLITKLPVIHGLNAIGGIAIGICNGTLLIWIMGLLMLFFVSNASMAPLHAALEQSTLANWFYTHNLLLQFISGIVH